MRRGRRIALLLTGVLPLLAKDDVPAEPLGGEDGQHAIDDDENDVSPLQNAAEALHDDSLSSIPALPVEILDFGSAGNVVMHEALIAATIGGTAGMDTNLSGFGTHLLNFTPPPPQQAEQKEQPQRQDQNEQANDISSSSSSSAAATDSDHGSSSAASSSSSSEQVQQMNDKDRHDNDNHNEQQVNIVEGSDNEHDHVDHGSSNRDENQQETSQSAATSSKATDSDTEDSKEEHMDTNEDYPQDLPDEKESSTTGASDATATGTEKEQSSGSSQEAPEPSQGSSDVIDNDNGAAAVDHAESTDDATAPPEGQESIDAVDQSSSSSSSTETETDVVDKQQEVSTEQQEQQEQQDSYLDDEDDESGERVVVDYASTKAGALIVEKSHHFKGTSNLLTANRDKYAISPCAEKKQVVIALSEDIRVKQIRIANYERFSSRVKEFQVFGSQTMGKYVSLGTFVANPENGEQSFDLEQASWARYLKFRFLSHYGIEHYCTISQIKVHGSTQLQGFHEEWEEQHQADTADENNPDSGLDPVGTGQEDAGSASHVDAAGTTNEQGKEDAQGRPSASHGAMDSTGTSQPAETDRVDPANQRIKTGAADSNGNSASKSSTEPEHGSANDATAHNTNVSKGSNDGTAHSDTSATTGDSQDGSSIPDNASSESSSSSTASASALNAASIDTSALKLANAAIPALSQLDTFAIHTDVGIPSSENDQPNVVAGMDSKETAEHDDMDPSHEKAKKRIGGFASDGFASFGGLADPVTASDVVREIQEKLIGLTQTIGTIQPMIFHALDMGDGGTASTDAPPVAEKDTHPAGSQQQQHHESTGTVEASNNNAREGTARSDSKDRQEKATPGSMEQQPSSVRSKGDDGENESKPTAPSSGGNKNNDRTTPQTQQPATTKVDAGTQTNSNANTRTNQDAHGQTHGTKDPLPEIDVSQVLRKYGYVSSAKCLHELDFAKYKARSMTASGSGSNTGERMEPIFKKLTDEIRSLQQSRNIQEHFLREVVACYQSVLLDVLQQQNQFQRMHDERYASLESKIELLHSTNIVLLVLKAADKVSEWLLEAQAVAEPILIQAQQKSMDVYRHAVEILNDEDLHRSVQEQALGLLNAKIQLNVGQCLGIMLIGAVVALILLGRRRKETKRNRRNDQSVEANVPELVSESDKVNGKNNESNKTNGNKQKRTKGAERKVANE